MSPHTIRSLCATAALAAVAPAARAGGKVVVVPVVIGAGMDASAEGTVALVPALAEGLGQNPRWEVFAGAAARRLREGGGEAPATKADWDRLSGLVDRVAAQIGKGAPADAVVAAEAAADEAQRAFRAGPWSPRGADVTFRAGALLAAALQAGGDAERARRVASETALTFRGRAPAAGDALSREAADLVAAAPAPSAAIALTSRPDGCDVFVNGQNAGKGHVEAEAAAGAVYWAWVVCPDGSRTAPRRIAPSPQASGHVDVLDAEFGRSLDCAGSDCRLHFASPADRRSMEEGYARRAAEVFETDAVVFASIGQFGGQDWLNARLYLANGFQVRQGLARLEPQRARALGSYLATGKEAPGVLRPDDAAALALAAQGGGPGGGRPRILRPWYADWLGWTLTGVGAAALAGGFVLRADAQAKTDEADRLRGDPDRRSQLSREAETRSFESFILLGVGGTLAATGIISLIIPEEATEAQLISLAPTAGGAAVILGGRF